MTVNSKYRITAKFKRRSAQIVMGRDDEGKLLTELYNARIFVTYPTHSYENMVAYMTELFALGYTKVHIKQVNDNEPTNIGSTDEH